MSCFLLLHVIGCPPITEVLNILSVCLCVSRPGTRLTMGFHAVIMTLVSFNSGYCKRDTWPLFPLGLMTF